MRPVLWFYISLKFSAVSTYKCDPLLLVLLSSSGAISTEGGPSGLGGLPGSGGAILNDALRFIPPVGAVVTVLKPGTENTS